MSRMIKTLSDKLEDMGIIATTSTVNTGTKLYFLTELMVINDTLPWTDPELYYSDALTQEEAFLKAICKLPQEYKSKL